VECAFASCSLGENAALRLGYHIAHAEMGKIIIVHAVLRPQVTVTINIQNFAIAEHLQSEGCCSPSLMHHHRALPSISGFCSHLVVHELVTPWQSSNQKDELSSSDLPGIGFKSNLIKVVLGQTKRSRAYAPDITFTVTENSVDPGPYCSPECRLRLKYRSQCPEVILGHGTGN